MLCTKCGRPKAEDAPFCSNCGAPASQASAGPSPTPSFTQAPTPPQTMGGYGAGWQPPQPPRRNRTGLIVGSVVAGIIVLAGLGLGLYFGLRGDDSEKGGSSTSTSATGEAFVQKDGEVFLEGAGEVGPESFTDETFVPVGPASTLNIPTTTAASLVMTTYAGDTHGLYGGSMSKALADKEGQLQFFEQNPDEAAAFCAALNSDATFMWSGGNRIEPSQLRDYFAELTPLMLIHDTMVTNHGYRDGKPTPRQSVLQKGQMVLVDQYGVPRVRCECGNPLTPPHSVNRTLEYTGTKWPGFDPATIIVVQPSTVVINIFVVVDIGTGETFDRPAGTTGDQDSSPEGGGDAASTTEPTAGAITPEEIKNAMGASGMGSPEQLQIYDYKNFGHYAAAYVMAADENVYLVLFNDETGGWAILCTYTGLDWEAVQADLRAKAAPEDLIEWANPGYE
jgi:hypothetical protein